MWTSRIKSINCNYFLLPGEYDQRVSCQRFYALEQTPFWQKLAAGQFWPCFGCPQSAEGDQMRYVSKIMRCQKKTSIGCNFQNIGSKMNQWLLMGYEPTLIRFGSDILKIVAMLVFFDGSF